MCASMHFKSSGHEGQLVEVSSVSLTAFSSLCRGSLWTVLPAKPPLKGEVPAICGRRGPFPYAAKVAAALSAAVTTAKPIEDAPNSHGRTSPKERTSLFPAALREKGSGEEGLLSEKPPPPQNLAPHKSLREGARGRSFSQRSRLPRITPHVPFPCSYFLSFYFYFVAEFIRTICTQALPNDCFCRTIGARSKRGGYLG